MRVWVATAVRLVLAAVWAWVGVARVADPAASVDAVRAYRLLPDVLERGVGYGLPFLALALAALLLAGLAHLSARLRKADWPDDRRVAAVVAVGLAAFAVLFGVMPASPDSIGVPANLVWQFRINSLTGNLLVWTLLTVGLGVVWAESARRPAESRATVASGAADGAQNSIPFSADTPVS